MIREAVKASSRLFRSLRLLHNCQLTVLVCPPPSPGAIIAREPQCRRERRCPKSANINIIPTGCHNSQDCPVLSFGGWAYGFSTIHSPPFFGPLWVISPSSVSLLTAFSIARVDIPIASAISRSDTFGLDCIISLIFTEVFTELSTELSTEPWSDCSVEDAFFFLRMVVKKPSVLYSAGGNPSSDRMRAIRGMPVPTLSTRCIRVNIRKMSGFLERLRWPKSAAT